MLGNENSESPPKAPRAASTQALYGASFSSNNEPKEKQSRWEQDMDLMHQGIKELFMNDFAKAEETFQQGMDKDEAIGEDEKDIRGAFALLKALLSLMQGIASFSDDQLVICEERLKEADALAIKQQNWAGKKVLRGIVCLLIGLMQIMQRKFARGIFNVLKSWTWIRTLKSEALVYEGKEKEVVRSAALFTLGSFYMLIGLLPPKTMKIAQFVSGFVGDLNQGLDMVKTCWEEAGMLQPWAALTIISFHTDTRTFLCLRPTKEDSDYVRNVLNWAIGSFPNSLFFTSLESDFIATETRNTAKAREMQNAQEEHMSKLPALVWALNYKRGAYELCDLNFAKAGDFFKASMKVYIDAKRRSMVPFMSAYSLLCYLQSKNEQGTEQMFKMLRKYKGLSKKNWGRQDEWAFRILKRYEPNQKNNKKSKKKLDTQWPLLDIACLMTLQVRLHWWMSKEQLEGLYKALKAEEDARLKTRDCTPDDQVSLRMVYFELFEHMGKKGDAHKSYSEALALESDLSSLGKDFGAIPMLEYFSAQMSYADGDLGATKYHIDRVKSYGSKYDLHDLITFKMVLLNKSVGTTIVEEYQSVQIPAGKSLQIDIPIDPEKFELPFVKWFWLVVSHTVSFRATFKAADALLGESVIQDVDRKEATGEATVGEFALEEYGVGTLTLVWDNSFSLLRSKTIKFRLSPNDLEMNQEIKKQ